MDLMVYIFPAALFVLTLIIMFVLRGEDSKSRTLKNINETLNSFRSESNQTIKRIQEATHDCVDSIEKKKYETTHIIEEINNGLQTLANHRDDLISLEGLCKTYENALENLRVQTERADEKVQTVNEDVRKAELISQSIKEFEVSSNDIKRDLLQSETSYRELCEKTEKDFNSIIESHRRSEEEMLTLFSDELDRKKGEFATHVEGVFDKLETKKGDIDNYLEEVDKDLEERKSRFNEAADQCIDNIDKKISSAEEFVDSQNQDLKTWKKEFDAYFEERREDDKKSEESYQTKVEEQINRLEELDKRLVEELNQTHEEIKRVLGELKASYTEEIGNDKEDFEARLEEHRKSLEEAKSKVEEELANLHEEYSKDISESRESLEERNSEILKAADDKVEEVRASVNELAKEAEEKTENVKSDMDNHFENIKSELQESFDKLSEENVVLNEKIDNSLTDFSLKRDEISKNTEDLKNTAEEKLKAFKDEVAISVDDARKALSDHTDEMTEKISQKGVETASDLDKKSEEAKESIQKTRDDAKALHSEQKSLIEQEEKEFEVDCRKALSNALSEEINDIKKVLDTLSASAIANIEKLAKSQTEFKETVSWLNQGVNETIENAVDRLQELQGKLVISEEKLEETNDDVTRTKEELLNLQRDHREWESKVDKMMADLEEADHRFKAIKQQRINEEGRLVKLKMEANSYEIQRGADSDSKKDNVTIETFPDDLDGVIL